MENLAALHLAECEAWRVYSQQKRRTRLWFWILMVTLSVSGGRFAAGLITGNHQSVWMSVSMIALKGFVFTIYLMVWTKSVYGRAAWRELFWQSKLESAKIAARSEAIRDFQDAMIKEMRAQRQAREEAAQADAARDGHAAHRYVQAQRLEIEGNCIDNG